MMLPHIDVSDHRVHMIVNDTLQKIDKQCDRITARTKKAGNPPTILAAQLDFRYPPHQLPVDYCTASEMRRLPFQARPRMSPPIRGPRLAKAKVATHKQIIQPVEVGRW